MNSTIDSNHPALRTLFNSIARWVEAYRGALDPGRPFGACDAEEVAGIARDLMMSPADLMTLSRKGPQGARLLHQMLLALGVDPKRIARQEPAVMRDLQRLCVTCANKRQCEHDLAEGTGAANYHQYCPNSYTLELLFDHPAEAAAPEKRDAEDRQH